MSTGVALLILIAGGRALADDYSLRFVRQIGVPNTPARTSTGNYWMSYVAWSHDGTQIAANGPTRAGGPAGAIAIWSFPEGRLQRVITADYAELSPRWRYVIGSKGVRDATTLEPLRGTAGRKIVGVAVTADDQRLAISLGGPNVAPGRTVVIDAATGRDLSRFGRLAPHSIAISPDGRYVATGHWRLAKLWDASTGRRLAVLRGAGHFVLAVEFSPDSRRLAVVSTATQIWAIEGAAELAHADSAGEAVAFSPDGTLLAEGSYGDGTLRLLETATGRLLDAVRISGFGCGSVAFSPDGRYLIAPSNGGVIKWPPDYGGTVRVFEVVPR